MVNEERGGALGFEIVEVSFSGLLLPFHRFSLPLSLLSLSLSLSLSFLFPRFKNVHVKETWLELVPRATETNNGGEHVMICRCAIRDYVIYALDQRRSNCSVFCSLPASRGIADFIYSFFIFLYIYIFFFFPLNIFFKYFDNEWSRYTTTTIARQLLVKRYWSRFPSPLICNLCPPWPTSH